MLQELEIDGVSDHLNIFKRDSDQREFGVELVISSRKTDTKTRQLSLGKLKFVRERNIIFSLLMTQL